MHVVDCLKIPSNFDRTLTRFTFAQRKTTDMCSVINSVLFLILINSLSAVLDAAVTSDQPALLVISFDGFRAEYLHRNITPNLDKFRSEGTSASHLLSVFPTVTYVNHHSIATVRISTWLPSGTFASTISHFLVTQNVCLGSVS